MPSPAPPPLQPPKGEKKKPDKTAEEKLDGFSILQCVTGVNLRTLARSVTAPLPSPGSGLIVHSGPRATAPPPAPVRPPQPMQTIQVAPIVQGYLPVPIPPALLPQAVGYGGIQYYPVAPPFYVAGSCSATHLPALEGTTTAKTTDNTASPEKPASTPAAPAPKEPTKSTEPIATSQASKVPAKPDFKAPGNAGSSNTTKGLHFIAAHTCAKCGRERSREFHKQHPLVPGQQLKATVCRRCLRKEAGTAQKAQLKEPNKPAGKENTKSEGKDPGRSRRHYRFVVSRSRSRSRSRGHRQSHRRDYDDEEIRYRYRRTSREASRRRGSSISSVERMRPLNRSSRRAKDTSVEQSYKIRERSRTPPRKSDPDSAKFREDRILQGYRHVSAPQSHHVAFTTPAPRGTVQTYTETSEQESQSHSAAYQSTVSRTSKHLQYPPLQQPISFLPSSASNRGASSSDYDKKHQLILHPASRRNAKRFELPPSWDDDPARGVRREIVVIRRSPSPNRTPQKPVEGKSASDVLSGYESYHRYHMTPPSPPPKSTNRSLGRSVIETQDPAASSRRSDTSKQTPGGQASAKRSSPFEPCKPSGLANPDLGATRPISERTIVGEGESGYWENLDTDEYVDIRTITTEEAGQW